MNLRCLLGRHKYEAELLAWYKNNDSTIAGEDASKEASMLAKTRAPSFDLPFIQCSRCGFIPEKIMDLLIKTMMIHTSGETTNE